MNQQQQSRGSKRAASQHGGPRRQENLRWASELSFAEGSCHWQEQVSQLQRQLDFSTSMCQTLLQDQQVGAPNHKVTLSLIMDTNRGCICWSRNANSVLDQRSLSVLCQIVCFLSKIIEQLFFSTPCFYRPFPTCYKPCWRVSTACYPTMCHRRTSTWSCTSSTSVTPSWLGSKTMCKGDNNNSTVRHLGCSFLFDVP